ncbi:protein pangolin, isoforms A/H/I/S isoform X4 [Drosophila eugracilis]|uniref:protein pangolin, isoforms A/H/I/S isoform X4 n=1 Tax=Drosophila eugracilis TaxID=29029 RepID=UPI001BDB0E1F|nr:protein pangolin, isoforms A/H/I/S isoform X4 [Drosophila eugracilis]XP_041674547.1 protein pangolin, isoforms A/H/I/S isoform X4 [Drosophila eugracilis]XP_041674548.1 protein pangolin, isoforms A/H/I/S isoform X4 [Drosophila eugracilis]XP_041674549.1 protein pangolin, isoforms A/H/I/S isoform X4 [Drosophila eugracilis]XP_041674550.1 protein pangolin, isoforms A/H/I/S isoform X4 [Drosophila eugracilis]XP_041674551.1 protein pangolin, isoforms A/H/I/S isoform X4 [Drosophila eugracilis]XP_04
MPHTHGRHGSSGDDLCSTDEVKIFKDEGDREDEKISSENLLVEEKSSLIDLTESEEKGHKIIRPDHSPVYNKLDTHSPSFNMGYLVSPYSYANGTPSGLQVTMANKIGLPPYFCHNADPLATPPPAHCGIPPYQLDPKTMGLTRPALYPFAGGQYPYPMLSSDMSQVASWHTPSVYSATSFRTPYPSSLPISTTLSSDFPFRFSPSLLPSVHAPSHHVLNAHSAIVGVNSKQDCGVQDTTTNNRYPRNLDTKPSSNTQSNDSKDSVNDKKKPHIKKPLNAFMLYMKEMRAKVVAECTLKESAAINQILGRRWHELSREEQSKYYEKARQERQLHMELYPGWSARDNYGYVSKKKKRKKDRSTTDSGGNNMKKCRARFGLDQQNQWCKPCRRKKKCIRYMEALNENGTTEDGSGIDDHESQLSDDDDDEYDDDKLAGSCGSADGNNKIKDDDTESLNQSMPSPGCFSGLSSLQSPSTTISLASPINMNINPTTNVIFPAANNSLLIVSAEQPQQRSTSVSTSGSSSGSTSSISTTPNTSSTVSPVTNTTGPSPSSSHERAMMLGNRFSHLGMGLSPPVVSTSSSKPEPFFQPHPAYNNAIFSLPSIGNSNLNNSSMPNISRNPIGANPRDINNPLSINQLTKRREYPNVELTEDSESHTIVAHAATSIIHHVAAHRTNHSLLNRSFSQHFHQKLTNHMETAKISESKLLSVSTHSVNGSECHKSSDPQKKSSNTTSSAGASEHGVISVS